MGDLKMKLIDVAILSYFLIIAFAVPLIDAQTILPLNLYPKFLIDLRCSLFGEIDQYFVFEILRFYVGIAWFELLFQWPLALICVYGIVASKSWFNTTSLIYGWSFCASLVAKVAGDWMVEREDQVLLLFLFLPTILGLLSFLRALHYFQLTILERLEKQEQANLERWKKDLI